MRGARSSVAGPVVEPPRVPVSSCPGLVLGALALVTTSGADEPEPHTPPDANRPAVADADGVQQAGYVTLRATGR